MSMFDERVEALAQALREWLFPGVDLPLGDSAWVGHVREVLLAADALEAATRVPVQGEPNDAVKDVIDRDVAIDAIAGGTISVPGGYGVLHGDDAANIVDAIIGHAAVPDAATEELEAQLTNAKAGWESALRIANEGNEIIKQVGAERDAAVAAIERVRAIHARLDTQSQYPMLPDMKPMKLQVCSHCKRPGAGDALHPWPCRTIAALDGAPEPEWEYGMQGDLGLSHASSLEDARRHASFQDQALTPRVVRRRKAGPWLPVEGESK